MSLYARLYMKWLWLRHSCTFNFAHKPLCERHRENVVRIGGVYLCRSCLCVYSGMIGGGAAVLLGAPQRALLMASIVALPIVVGMSVPPLYRKLPRVVRDVLRLTTGTLVTVGVWVAVMESVLVGAGALAVLGLSYLPYSRMRATQKRVACKGCAESLSVGVCSGYVMQAERIREYECAASEYLTQTGHVPNCIRKPGRRTSEVHRT